MSSKHINFFNVQGTYLLESLIIAKLREYFSEVLRRAPGEFFVGRKFPPHPRGSLGVVVSVDSVNFDLNFLSNYIKSFEFPYLALGNDACNKVITGIMPAKCDFGVWNTFLEDIDNGSLCCDIKKFHFILRCEVSNDKRSVYFHRLTQLCERFVFTHTNDYIETTYPIYNNSKDFVKIYVDGVRYKNFTIAEDGRIYFTHSDIPDTTHISVYYWTDVYYKTEPILINNTTNFVTHKLCDDVKVLKLLDDDFDVKAKVSYFASGAILRLPTDSYVQIGADNFIFDRYPVNNIFLCLGDRTKDRIFNGRHYFYLGDEIDYLFFQGICTSKVFYDSFLQTNGYFEIPVDNLSRCVNYYNTILWESSEHLPRLMLYNTNNELVFVYPVNINEISFGNDFVVINTPQPNLLNYEYRISFKDITGEIHRKTILSLHKIKEFKLSDHFPDVLPNHHTIEITVVAGNFSYTYKWRKLAYTDINYLRLSNDFFNYKDFMLQRYDTDYGDFYIKFLALFDDADEHVINGLYKINGAGNFRYYCVPTKFFQRFVYKQVNVVSYDKMTGSVTTDEPVNRGLLYIKTANELGPYEIAPLRVMTSIIPGLGIVFSPMFETNDQIQILLDLFDHYIYDLYGAQGETQVSCIWYALNENEASFGAEQHILKFFELLKDYLAGYGIRLGNIRLQKSNPDSYVGEGPDVYFTYEVTVDLTAHWRLSIPRIANFVPEEFLNSYYVLNESNVSAVYRPVLECGNLALRPLIYY